MVDLILKYFSEEALKYTTVVFTHGDELPEDMEIKEWIRENKALNTLVQKCGGRCHVFDNKRLTTLETTTNRPVQEQPNTRWRYVSSNLRLTFLLRTHRTKELWLDWWGLFLGMGGRSNGGTCVDRSSPGLLCCVATGVTGAAVGGPTGAWWGLGRLRSGAHRPDAWKMQ
uniref:AIG1-type G domain-containing protein n=1 Tax=Knipowitschia caucasica TaxID=637954 RepID=A0AAV2KJZ6_KNICA